MLITPMIALLPRCASADSVTLKSGAVLRGEILAEDAYEVRLAVSRTAGGEIRTVKIIDQSIVDHLQRSTPDLEVEAAPSPIVSDGSSTSAPASPAPDDLRAALEKADQQTATGSYDEAAITYRGVIAEAKQRSSATNAPAVRLDLLEVRDDACTHLLIALEGKLKSRKEAVKAAEQSAQELEQRLIQQRTELAHSERVAKNDEADAGPRRLGHSTETAAATIHVRELRERIALDDRRLKAQQEWVRSARLALVNWEAEIHLARDQAQQAADDLASAQREIRARH